MPKVLECTIDGRKVHLQHHSGRTAWVKLEQVLESPSMFKAYISQLRRWGAECHGEPLPHVAIARRF